MVKYLRPLYTSLAATFSTDCVDWSNEAPGDTSESNAAVVQSCQNQRSNERQLNWLADETSYAAYPMQSCKAAGHCS